MKYILSMVLLVFTLGVYAETLPVSVTTDNDVSYNSITNDCDLISTTDYVATVDFEFYDDFDTGNSFTLCEVKKATALIQTCLLVNDVGKDVKTGINSFTVGHLAQTPLTYLVYRRSRDGLMCFLTV